MSDGVLVSASDGWFDVQKAANTKSEKSNDAAAAADYDCQVVEWFLIHVNAQYIRKVAINGAVIIKQRNNTV